MWPARFIGFGVGMIIYAIMVNYYFNEGITLKTWVSLLLSVALICISILSFTKISQPISCPFPFQTTLSLLLKSLLIAFAISSSSYQA